MIKLKRISLKEAAEATWEQVSRFYYYVKDEAALDYFTTHDNPEYAKKYKDELHLRWNPGTKKYEFSQWSTFYPMYFHAGYDKALEEVFPNRAWLSMFDSDTGKIKKEAYGEIKNLLNNSQYKNLGYELLNIWRFFYGSDAPSNRKIVDAPVSYQKFTELDTDIIKKAKEQMEKICKQGIEDNPEIKELLSKYTDYDSKFKAEITAVNENNIPEELKLTIEVKNKETSAEYKNEIPFDSKYYLSKIREDYIKGLERDRKISDEIRKRFNNEYFEKAAEDTQEAVNTILIELYKYFKETLPYQEDDLTLREKLARLLGVDEEASIVGGILNGNYSSDATHHCTIICMSPTQQLIGIGYNKNTEEAEVSIKGKKYSINREYSKIKALIKDTSFKIAAIFNNDSPRKDNRGNGKSSVSAKIVDESGPMLKYFLDKYPQIVWDPEIKKYVWTGKDDPSCSVRFEYDSNFIDGERITFAHHFWIRYTYWPLD